MIFAVDMFNEGVDVPTVDTVLMLRPTESRVLWLQQLGRGLRRAEGKNALTVIDYIGNHRTFMAKVVMLLQELRQDGQDVAAALQLLRNGSAELSPGCLVTYELESIQILEALLPRQRKSDALPVYYLDFRQKNGVRPLAVEAYHDGYNPRSARKQYGSWARFVRQMEDSQSFEFAIEGQALEFLSMLEILSMKTSICMMLLKAMLVADALPGEMFIHDLAAGVERIARRSARLGKDLGAALGHREALQSLLQAESMSLQDLRYESGHFRLRFTVPEAQRMAFRELAHELVEWRLAEYVDREEGAPSGQDRFLGKVRQTYGRPILFLPDRARHPWLPLGKTPILVEGELYEADFVKVALNVVHRKGSTQNELPEILRRWFGPDVGQPGTRFNVVFEKTEDSWMMAPEDR